MKQGCLSLARECSYSKEVSCTYTSQPLSHALDRSKDWHSVTPQHMSQVKHILILTCLVLSFLVGVPDKSLSSDLHLRQAEAADIEGYTTEAEHSSTPCKWRSPLKSVAKRKIDSAALPLVTHGLIMHPCDHALSRSCHSSATVVYQATPLYQSLQVYRC